MLMSFFHCCTGSLGLLTEQVNVQLQDRPSKEVEEAIQMQHFTSQKSVFMGHDVSLRLSLVLPAVGLSMI